MALTHKNFHHFHKVGVALQPQSTANQTVNGETILEPWRDGDELSFILLGGAFAASASGRAQVQVRARSGGAWSNAKESDGTTDLEFTAADLDDAEALEGGALLGTLDLGYVDSETYDAVRLEWTAEHGSATQLVGAAYVISGSDERVTGQADDLWAKQRP